MANANHIFSLARTKYHGIHWWQDAGIEIRSLLLFENPVRVVAICSSFPREKNDRIEERTALVLPICSNLRWKWLYSSSVLRPSFTWKCIANFQKAYNERFFNVIFFFLCLNKLWNDSFLQEEKKSEKKWTEKKKRGFFASNIRQHKINLAFAMKSYSPLALTTCFWR